jgi:uncharacterized protein DUF1573
MNLASINSALSSRIKIQRLISTCSIALCCSLILLAISRHKPAGVDRTLIGLTPQFHDFSAIPAGTKAEYTFVGRNDLSSAINVDRLDRSCGCTSATLDRSVIGPGESFSIKAILSAPDFPQAKSSRIILRGHAGKQSVLGNYSLHAIIENVLEFPDSGGGSLQLGSKPLAQLPATFSVKVNRGKFPLQFDELRAEPSAPGVSARVMRDSDSAWCVLVSVPKADTLGTLGFPIEFRFARQGRELPERVIKQAYMEFAGPVAASPPSLLFTVARGKHSQQQITISSADSSMDDGKQVTSVQLPPSNWTTNWQGTESGSTVSFDYAAPDHMGPDRGAIVIEVKDHGQIYKVKVGYVAMVS